MITFLFFADDWGRHPSSPQYLARELARYHRVLWVNTIGMRRPRLDLYTLRRSIEKLRQWMWLPANDTTVPLRLRVVCPYLIPDWRTQLFQRLNKLLLTRSLQNQLGIRQAPVIGVTAIPLPASWLDALPVELWVYYCVDNFADWPGLDGETLRQCEMHTLSRARMVIAASEQLQLRLTALGRTVKLLTHGIDLSWWINHCQNSVPNVVRVNRPAALWWGLIDERIDWDCIAHAASRLAHVSFLLVGPVQYCPPWVSRYSNVHFLGRVPVQKLPSLAQHADVLMMPYRDHQVTRYMQPLKLLEYLATDKPIVARRLPAIERWKSYLQVFDTKEEFTAQITTALERNLSPEEIEARRKLLQSESWQAKARQFLTWLVIESMTNSFCISK